jgi:hypothetical protein
MLLTLQIEAVIWVDIVVGHVDVLDGAVADASNDEGDVADGRTWGFIARTEKKKLKPFRLPELSTPFRKVMACCADRD